VAARGDERGRLPSRKETFKLGLLLVSTVGIYFLTENIEGVPEQWPAVTHLFYVPIIMAGVWWSHRLWMVAAVVGTASVFDALVLHDRFAWGDAYLQAGMFILVTGVTVALCRKRARTAEALHASDEKFRAVFDGAEDAIFIKDRQLKVVDANAAALRGAGLRREDMLGKTPREIYGEEEGSRLEEGDTRALAGETVHQDVRLTNVGKPRDLHIIKGPLRDREGNITGLFGISRNVTQRKQVLQVLREERDRAHKYLDVAGVMILALNAEGKVTLINRKGCEVLGYEKKDILGKDWFGTFLPEETRDNVRQVFQALMDGKIKAAEYHENAIITRDGSRRIISWHNTVLRDAEGRISGTLGSGLDSTQRVQVEEDLKELKNLVNRSPALVLVRRVQPDAQPVVYVSENIEVLLGYTPQELLSGTCSWTQIIYPEDAERLGKEVAEYLDQGRHRWSHEYRLTTRKGDVRWFRDRNWTVRDDDEKVTHIESILVDVTEQRQAHERLRESEAKYAALVEHAADGVLVIQDEKLRLVNPAIASMLGYRVEELREAEVRKVLPPESAEEIIGNYHRRMAGESIPSVYELDLLCRDGSTRKVELSASIVQLDGRPADLALLPDVTERRRAEEELRRSERALRDILEAASTVSFITTDLKGVEATITGFSTGAEHIFGYRREEAIGQPLANLHLPEQVTGFPRVIEKMRRTHKPITKEMELVRKSGEHFPALLTTYPILDSTGEMTGVLGVSIDITERRRAERDLRRSHDYLNNILNGMHEGLLVVDRDLAIRDVNASLATRSHMTREELIGRHCHEIMAGLPEPCPNEDWHCPIRLVFRTGVPIRIDHKFTGPDGKEASFDTYTFPLFDKDGSVELAVQIQDDVTERARAERMRQQSEKLAATGRMAARVAHEINNPLAGIKHAFLLIKDAVPHDHPHYAYTRRIENEIERIARIVRNMYDLYTPEQEKPRRFVLSEAINDVVALLEPRGREGEVELKVEMPERPAGVNLPKGSVFQVLFNVIQNAIDASPRGAQVTVRMDTTPEEFRIDVIDHGTGIPEELHGRIFEPFFTTRHNHGGVGLGLGLPISRSLTEAMGGKLDFETEMGKGTVFHIHLPATDKETEEPK